ncbi:MAG: fumarylacetoacetate hydrolase family protein [Deltaproteobacteria bacterium]|nr:fumarylacetoacetate hydrolase family protein [Deltaproteobacteria bacterium]
MKLATLDDGTRDGQLVLISRDGTRATSAQPVCRTMQEALERWEDVEPALKLRAQALEAGRGVPEMVLEMDRLLAPLPRAYQFVDGSAYLNHIELVRKARGAEMPASFLTDPLVYQAVSDRFLAPHAPIPVADEAYGIDFEGEVGVLTGDVPAGVSAANAPDYVRLLVLINDVSLRNLIPGELAKGFGFLQSKPPSALSPFAVTPDELGPAWRDGRVWLPLEVSWNGERFGDPNAGVDMHFDFFQLIAHTAKTRPLGAGTLIGSGTVSNRDRSRGSCCIAERRMIEKIDTGEFRTPFMRFGDRVRIEMRQDGLSVFGAIEQTVVSQPAPRGART